MERKQGITLLILEELSVTRQVLLVPLSVADHRPFQRDKENGRR